MFKSKSMPIRSKKLSLSRMKRTSIVTCKSCRRRKLLQQVGDFFVHRLRLADDEAEVGGEGPDFRLAAAVLGPGVGGDGRDDQVDQRIEVGIRAAAHAAGPAAESARLSARPVRRRPRAGAKLLGQTSLFGRHRLAFGPSIVDEHGRPRRTESAAAIADRGVRVVDQALQADVVARHEVRNRHHQVGHVVGLGVDLAVAELFAGDLEHFVLDRRSSGAAARGSGSAHS